MSILTLEERTNRLNAWFKRQDEKWRVSVLPICKDIERMLFRMSRGDIEATAEVLNARATRERVIGK